jgi:hypothetical protein
MRHIQNLGFVLAAIVGFTGAATPVGATPKPALPAKAAAIVLVNGPMMGGGGGGGGGGGFGGVGAGLAIGALLGGIASQPAAPQQQYYPPPQQYYPPPQQFADPLPQAAPPPVYSAAPSPAPDTPVSDAAPPRAAPSASPSPYQSAQQAMPAAANDTLNTTVTATPPPDTSNMTVQQIVDAANAAKPAPAPSANPVFIDDVAGKAITRVWQATGFLEHLRDPPTSPEVQAQQENELRIKWGMQPKPAAPRPTATSTRKDALKGLDQLLSQ